MAAFSYKFQNNNNNNNNNIVDYYSLQNVLQIPPPINMQEPNNVGCFRSNEEEEAAYNKTCTDNDSSSVTDKLQTSGGEQQQQQEVTKTRKSKEELLYVDSCPSQEKIMCGKRKRVVMKKVEEKKMENKVEQGYIHVRARRGQATDNHSLAERVRREKISERMKMLQALVPGCAKVTGKALMLDEIINYVQSLQNQVEFLSMKLASLNPMFYDFGLDLDSFFTRPHQTLCSLEEPPILQNMHQMQPPMLYHDTLPNIANNCNGQVVDSSSSPFHLLPQNNNNNNIIPHQEKGQVLWDVDDDDQRYILGNQQHQGFNINNLSSLQYYIE